MPYFDRTGSGPGSFADDSERWRSLVRLLAQRFPSIDVLSLQAFERNVTFRELCEEYEACLDAVDRSAPSTDDAIHREYVALQLRLEGELLRYLEQQAGSVRR